jgi:hypothetical protein
MRRRRRLWVTSARCCPACRTRAAPASASTPASEPDEDGEAEEAQDREDDGEKEEFADPVPRPQNTRTIEIERFVPAGQVDLRYFEKRITLCRGTLSVRRRSRSSATR